MPVKRPEYRPWLPVQVAKPGEADPFGRKLTFGDASALQAVMRGEASKEQQQQAMAAIINVISGKDEMSFDPLDHRGTDFAEGRRFVGNQIVKVLRLNLSALANPSKPTEQG